MSDMTDDQAFGAASGSQDGLMTDDQAFGERESAAKAFARRAGGALIPSAAGLAAAVPAAGAAALAAAPADPFTLGGASVVSGLVAGGLAAYGVGSIAQSAQNKVLKSAPETAEALGQSPEEIKQDEEQHPIASFAGGLAPNLIAFTPGGITKEGLAVMGTIGGAQEAAREEMSGEGISPTKIALSSAAMGLMQKPTSVTRALESRFGASNWVKKNYADNENAEDIVSPLSEVADMHGPDAVSSVADGNPPTRPVTIDSTQQVQNAFHDGIDEPRQATQSTAALDVALATVPGSDEILPRAQSSKVIGGDEEHYFDQAPPTETQKQAIDNVPERESPLDIHEVARQENPAAFENYSRLLIEKDVVRERLLDESVHQEKLQGIHDSTQGTDTPTQTELSPEVQALRDRLTEINKNISELGPQIADAYKTAQEKMPKIGYADNVDSGTNIEPNTIAEDWESKLTKAGVDQATAKLHGEIQKAYYEQMSKDTGRSATDLYNKGVSDVKAAKGRVKGSSSEKPTQTEKPITVKKQNDVKWEDFSKGKESSALYSETGNSKKPSPTARSLKATQEWVKGKLVDVGLVKNLLISESVRGMEDNNGNFVPGEGKGTQIRHTLISKPDAEGWSKVYQKYPHGGLQADGKIKWDTAVENYGLGESKTLAQDNGLTKGTYDIPSRVIKLFTGRYDVSTIVHETMHAWLEQRFEHMNDPDVSQRFKDDMNNLRDWAGFVDGENAGSRSYTAAHEKVARAFERYMSEGRAPTSALARVFSQFKQMLGSLYDSMKRSNYKINDDIRDVFDRFFTSNPEKIVVAPEAETASHMASVHTQDARETTPEHADKVRDNVESEILKLAEPDPEAKDAITNASQTGEIPSDATGSPEPAVNSPAQEPSQVGAGGGATGAESAPERAEPAAASTGTGDRAAAEQRTADADARARNPYAETEPNGTEYLDKAGNIRLDNLKSTEDVKQVLRDIARENNGFTADRGGRIPNSVRRGMADALGLDAENFDPRKPANVSNSVWAEAVQKLAIQSVQAVDEAAQKFARTGAIEDDIAYTEAKSRATMVVKNFSNITAEAGRTLKVFDKSNMKMLKDSGDILDQLEQSNNGLTLKQRQAQATMLSEMKTPQQKAKFLRAEEKPDFVEKILEYRNNCLLSGPITHLHYIDGNIINTLYKPLKVALASVGGKVELGEAGAMYNALTYGSVKGFKAAAAAWRDPMSGELPEILHSNRQQAINGKLGSVVNAPMDAINSIHVFFKSVRYEQEIARSSYEAARNEGLQPGTKSFTDRISDLTQSPTQDMMANAFKISKTENYMENFDRDSVLGKLNALANTTVGRFLFPFNKISMNVIRLAARDNTVLGVLSPEVRSILAGDQGSKARDLQIAGMAMGTVVMGVAYTMQDSINGGGPAEPNANKIWRLTHQPNSVQIGNISMPLKAFGTVGELMRMAAEYRDAVGDASHEESDKMAGHIMDHVSRVFLNGGLVDGISKLIESIHYGNIAPELQNFVTGFVPFSTLGSQAARYEDSNARVVHSQGLENFYGITDAIKKKIPFMSEDLQPLIDSFGNHIDSDKYLGAGGYERYNSDPVVQRLQSLNIGISKVPRAIRGVALSEQQYTDFSVSAGHYTYANLKDIMNDPDFAKQTPKEQRKQITKAVGEARKDARDDMMQKYPRIMDAADRAQEE